MWADIAFFSGVLLIFALGIVLTLHQRAPWWAVLTTVMGAAGAGYKIYDLIRISTLG